MFSVLLAPRNFDATKKWLRKRLIKPAHFIIILHSSFFLPPLPCYGLTCKYKRKRSIFQSMFCAYLIRWCDEVAHLQCHKGHLRVICIPSLFLLLDQFSLRTFGQPQGCAPIPHNQAKSRDNIFQSLLNKFQQVFFTVCFGPRNRCISSTAAVAQSWIFAQKVSPSCVIYPIGWYMNMTFIPTTLSIFL